MKSIYKIIQRRMSIDDNWLKIVIGLTGYLGVTFSVTALMAVVALLVIGAPNEAILTLAAVIASQLHGPDFTAAYGQFAASAVLAAALLTLVVVYLRVTLQQFDDDTDLQSIRQSVDAMQSDIEHIKDRL